MPDMAAGHNQSIINNNYRIMKKILLSLGAAMLAGGALAGENVIATMYPGNATLIGWGCDGLMEQPYTEDGRECVKIAQTAEGKNSWEVQFAFDAEGGYEIGTTYYFTFDVKGTPSEGIPSGFQCTDGYIGCGNMNNFAITEDWNTVTVSGTVTDPGDGKSVQRWVASIGNYTGTFYISNMKLYTKEESGEEPATGWVSLIQGGVAADGQTESLRAGWSGPAPVVANPAGEGVVFEAPIAANPANEWDSQFFIVFNESLEEGVKVKISFDYYCSDTRTISTQAQGEPGAYHHWTFCGALDAKPEWQTLSQEVTISAAMTGEDNSGCKTIAFNLASAPEAATFYINNVVVEKESTDAVETIETVKSVRNGVYTINGMRVADRENLLPGLYIIDGKKVLVK